MEVWNDHSWTSFLTPLTIFFYADAGDDDAGDDDAGDDDTNAYHTHTNSNPCKT